MKKIKQVFNFIITLLFNPIKTIASINLSERFITYVSKHIWVRLVISLLLASLMFYLAYYTSLLN